VSDEELAKHVAAFFNLSVANLAEAEPQALSLISDNLAHNHNVFPIRQNDGHLVVATSDPTDLDVDQDIRFSSGRTPVLEIAPPSAIAQAIMAYYSPDRALQRLLNSIEQKAGGSVRVIQPPGPESIDRDCP
jgi:hypothetical protein